MCGICGILHLNGSPVDVRRITKMLGTLRHRGPDDCGLFSSGKIALGHARLSIIDLTCGHQPMQNADGTLCITFNGEIFNYLELRAELEEKGYRFRTHSDTEVILHLYAEQGECCVRRLNGQWAFAIWDSERQKLFLSRDRLGVRPLFYTQTSGSFFFASEIKGLLALPEVSAAIDFQSLSQIFTFWSPVPPRTAFRNIFQLPPGCSLTIQGDQFNLCPHWSLSYPSDSEFDARNEDKLAEELFELLRDATRIRLRADVPVGAYLSGGIDSTVTTALVGSLIGDRLRSFSIRFEDAEFDESVFQEEASSYLRTQHTSVTCSRSAIAQVLPEVIQHTEQPIVRTAPAPMFILSKLVRESGFKVVVTGEGADEFFGGYDIFKETKIRRFWGRDLSSRLRPLLLRRLYPYMSDIQRQSPAYLQFFFHVNNENLTNPFFSHLPRWELTTRLHLLLSEQARAGLNGYDAIRELDGALPDAFPSWCSFNQAEYLEATMLLPGYILSAQGDRVAMAHSVEGRYPFLDHRVVDFALRIPPHLKMKVLCEKYLLKRTSANLIPTNIRKRTKQPYRAPEGMCFFGPDAPEYVEELLSADALKKIGIFDAKAVTTLVNKFRCGRANSTKDNMGLVGVLSTQLLVHQFSNQRGRSFEQ